MNTLKCIGTASCVAVLGFLALGAGTASASAYLYTFNQDQCSGSGGCLNGGTGGTVTVSDVTVNGSAEVEVDVQLASGLYFLNTGGSNGIGASFAFNIDGNPTITDSSIPTGWSLESTTAGTIHMPGLGYFGYGLNCDSCGNGASSYPNLPNSLSFDISGAFDAADLDSPSIANLRQGTTTDSCFAADVYSHNTRNTGPIGASCSPSLVQTPEPATLGLLALGLAGLGVISRRKSRRIES